MGYLTGGNEIVDAMGSINISGNIIPAVWYRTITKENGKPYLLAIVILADIVYWYRPSEVRDQGTGHIVGWKKKFSDDLLRQSYQYYAELFGESKKTIKTAMDKLEKLQVIRREFRTVSYGDGLVCNNVMYVELKPDMLYQLTFPEEIPAMNGANNSHAGVSDDKMGGSLPTKSDTPMEILGGRGIPKGTQVSTNLDIGHDETDHTLPTKTDIGLSQNGDTYSYTSTNISDRESNHINQSESEAGEMIDRIQDFLPEKFADAAVEVNQIVKNNDCALDGLMVRTEESNIAPTIYLKPYFEQIQDGAELDDVLAQIASVYQSHYIDHDIDVSAVTDFDKIKEKIVCKLINEEANQQFLQDKPYSKLEDLAVVYQILMDKTGEGTATITITDNLMDGYGITLEELRDQALQNMDTLQPHSFKGMNETVAEMIAVDIARDQNIGMDEAKEMAMQMMPDIPDTMFVLTNDTKVNGAAAILNDDIRQEIAEKVGDFYMLPSSIHETLIIPKEAGMEFKELEQMVQEVNQTQVAPGERLSDHVYEYDAKEHELFRSDRAEERVKQKEEKRDNRHERVSVKEKLAEKKDAVIKMNAGKEHSAPEKKKEAVI